MPHALLLIVPPRKISVALQSLPVSMSLLLQQLKLASVPIYRDQARDALVAILGILLLSFCGSICGRLDVGEIRIGDGLPLALPPFLLLLPLLLQRAKFALVLISLAPAMHEDVVLLQVHEHVQSVRCLHFLPPPFVALLQPNVNRAHVSRQLRGRTTINTS
jgi:hypothetical protein